MAEELIILKEITDQKDDFKVVQKGLIIESINKLNQVFHYIDLTNVKQGIFCQAWVGFRTVDQLKGVLDGHFMKVYQQYKSKSVINDASRMSGSFDEANEWLATIFMPKLIGMGLQNVATILPQNVFAQMAVEEWDKKITGFNTRNFGTFNDGLNWLKSV